MSLICVIGATGTQGGSVCRQMAKDPAWKVRGLCRNVNSDASKELQALGVEMVSADVNDTTTLAKAFEGATAIFTTGYFWNEFPTRGLHGAGQAELQQFINIANAASKVNTLKHLILSVLPHCDEISGGQFPCPHWDYKALGGKYVRDKLPELAAKTTFLWVGWYLDNFAAQGFEALMAPQPLFDKYILALPSRPDAKLPIAGVVAKNTGITVQGILAAGVKAYGKYVPMITEYLSMTQVTEGWSKVMGKVAIFAEVPDKEYQRLLGEVGAEVSAQLRFSEKFPNWHEFNPQETLSLKDLGVADKVYGYYDGLEVLKQQIKV